MLGRESRRNEGRTRWREGFGPAGVFYGPPVASSARELFMLGGSWGYGPAVIFYGPSRLPAPTSLMRREAQERVRRLGEIWTGPATEVTFAWAHMIGSMRARRSRERPRNEGGPQLNFYGYRYGKHNYYAFMSLWLVTGKTFQERETLGHWVSRPRYL